MSVRPVRVHSCQRATRESGPLDCGCKRHISKNRAKELVLDGAAVFRKLPDGRPNDLEIALVDPVLVHSCRHAAIESGPLDCRCGRHITKALARKLIREGLAVYRKFQSGRLNELEIALLMRELIPARTIDATAIQNAYVEGKVYERERIEIYEEVV